MYSAFMSHSFETMKFETEFRNGCSQRIACASCHSPNDIIVEHKRRFNSLSDRIAHREPPVHIHVMKNNEILFASRLLKLTL